MKNWKAVWRLATPFRHPSEDWDFTSCDLCERQGMSLKGHIPLAGMAR